MIRFRQAALLFSVLLLGCKSDDPQAPSAPKKAPGPTDYDAISGPAGATAPPARFNRFSGPLLCERASHWTPLSLETHPSLKLAVADERPEKPTLTWTSCDKTPYCKQLALAPTQRLHGLGTDGNRTEFAVSEFCNDHSTLLLSTADDPAHVALRTTDLDLVTSRTGAGRFVISAQRPAQGDAEPESFLLSGLTKEPQKLHAIRVKQSTAIQAVGARLVSLKRGSDRCTGRFWKLADGSCELRGPKSPEFAFLGKNVIFELSSRGKSWSIEGSTKELLPSLAWVLSDGVNLLWSDGQAAHLSQPGWDLAQLSSSPLPGPAGPRPLAFGCGRVLQADKTGLRLRNLKTGSFWRFPQERLPSPLGELFLSCHDLFTSTGYRLALKGLGELTELKDAP